MRFAGKDRVSTDVKTQHHSYRHTANHTRAGRCLNENILTTHCNAKRFPHTQFRPATHRVMRPHGVWKVPKSRLDVHHLLKLLGPALQLCAFSHVELSGMLSGLRSLYERS
jgi:hypothetical protein